MVMLEKGQKCLNDRPAKQVESGLDQRNRRGGCLFTSRRRKLFPNSRSALLWWRAFVAKDCAVLQCWTKNSLSFSVLFAFIFFLAVWRKDVCCAQYGSDFTLHERPGHGGPCQRTPFVAGAINLNKKEKEKHSIKNF